MNDIHNEPVQIDTENLSLPKKVILALFAPWSVKQVISLVLFNLLIIALTMLGASVSMINPYLMMYVSGGFGLLFAAPAYMLCAKRTAHVGVTTGYAMMFVLLCALMSPYYAQFGYAYILVCLLIDLIILNAPEHLSNPKRLALAWTIWGMFYNFSAIFPIVSDIEAYKAQSLQNGVMTEATFEVFTKVYADPVQCSLIVLIAGALAALGCVFGARILKRHFSRS